MLRDWLLSRAEDQETQAAKPAKSSSHIAAIRIFLDEIILSACVTHLE
jgi:hypothetical protein